MYTYPEKKRNIYSNRFYEHFIPLSLYFSPPSCFFFLHHGSLFIAEFIKVCCSPTLKQKQNKKQQQQKQIRRIQCDYNQTIRNVFFKLFLREVFTTGLVYKLIQLINKCQVFKVLYYV